MQNLNSHSLQRMCVFFLMTTTRLSYKAIVISNTNSDAKKKNNCPNITIILHGNFKKLQKMKNLSHQKDALIWAQHQIYIPIIAIF